jgi:hypothetical protein
VNARESRQAARQVYVVADDERALFRDAMLPAMLANRIVDLQSFVPIANAGQAAAAIVSSGAATPEFAREVARLQSTLLRSLAPDLTINLASPIEVPGPCLRSWPPRPSAAAISCPTRCAGSLLARTPGSCDSTSTKAGPAWLCAEAPPVEFWSTMIGRFTTMPAVAGAIGGICVMTSISCERTDAKAEWLLADSTCRDCGVNLSRIVTLGDEADGQIGEPTSIAKDSRGRYIVTTRARPGGLLVFDPDGRFNSTIGRTGAGPGEYSLPEFVLVDTHDSVHVIDVGAHRRTILTPAHSFVRSHLLRGSFEWDAALLDDGRMIANLYHRRDPGKPEPIHLVDPEGEIVESFGRNSGDTSVAYLPSVTFRKLAVSGDSAIWSARINEYRVELWSLSGEVQRELIRAPAPFSPWVRAHGLVPDQPPQSQLLAIHATSGGFLLVLYQVADDRWRASLERAATPEGEFFRPTSVHDVYDTVVEVIDPARALVIASGRLDPLLLEFVNDSLAYSFNEFPVPQVTVWAVRFRVR